MTVGIYQMQSNAVRRCCEAQEAFRQPGVASEAEGVGALVEARLLSLSTLASVCIGMPYRVLKHVGKTICIPLLSDFSFVTVVRMAIATALVVSLTALRILSSLGGIVSPELTFGVLRIHRLLLRLGLIYRSQFSYTSPLPEPYRIKDQRWRWGIVVHALQQIDDAELHGRRVSNIESGTRFRTNVWQPAERQALADEFEVFINEIRSDVRVSHPLLEAFQRQFSQTLHAEALAVCRQNLYTKDEVEDMVTAFTPVMHRATCDTIAELFRAAEQEVPLRRSENITVTELLLQDGQTIVLKDVLLADGQPQTVEEVSIIDGQRIRSVVASVPLGDVRSMEERILRDGEKVVFDDITIADGKEIAGRDAGGLEDWKQQLLEIVLLLNRMPEDTRSALSYYLCADEERLRRVRPDLPALSTNPVLDRCFKLIVEFYTTFVAHHMPEDASRLQEAFTLNEISL